MAVHYFSNGTEHRWWAEAWCDRCLHDLPFQSRGVGNGCPIIREIYWAQHGEGSPPPQIIENDRTGIPPQWFTCIEFKPYGYRKPGPPQPKPTPPGQGILPLDDPVPVLV